MKHAINWFEIPTANFDRAAAFYAEILGAPLRHETVGGLKNAVLFTEQNDAHEAVGGSIVYNPGLKPGDSGTVPYLNCDGALDSVVARVEPAGGKVLMPKTDIGFGFISLIRDSEGNKIGLHSGS